MELQWPLILFTSILAAGTGLFCVQGINVLAGEGQKTQLRATIDSLALLVIGGIAVFFHLTHPDRIFNGFGHLSSGITQELIAIVIVAVLMVLFILLARKGDVPKWLGALAVIAALALVIVMGHSYMMAARPAWNSVLQPLSLLGTALAVGAGIFAALASKDDGEGKLVGILALAGTALNAVLTIAYVVVMNAATGKFAEVGTYIDPTHPTAGVLDPSVYSPFSSSALGLTIGAIVLALAAVVLAVLGWRKKSWSVSGWLIAACAFVSAILLRMVFYLAGGSVFLFY